MIKFGLWIAGLAIAGGVVAAPSEQVGHIRLEWKMSLDASGTITHLDPKPGRANKIMHSVLEAAIRSWTFEPGSINGKQAETDTNLSVLVSLWPTADGENYSVRVDNVLTGGSFGRMRMKIEFPKREVVLAREKRINPIVLLEVAYDGSGKVQEVIVSDLSPVKDGALVKASSGPVRTWTFVPERVAGAGVGARALVPICFVAKKRQPDQEECQLPSALGGGPFEPGSSIALESRVTLKSDVIGKIL